MMIATYDADAYVVELETEVTRIERCGSFFVAVTADTIFYPEGGGQPADQGTIGGSKVIDVRSMDGVIQHILHEPVDLGPAKMVLDWERRFDHMQQHTGQHLLTAVAADRFGWKTTAFHLGELVSDIELDTPELTASDLSRLEEAVNSLILAGKPIRTRRVSRDEFAGLAVRSRGLPEGHSGTIRLIEIEDVDLNTCGGTHLRSTAELGSLCLLDTERLRGGTRLFFVAGTRVRRRMAEHEQRTSLLRQAFDASNEQLVEEARRRESQLRSTTKKLRSALKELAAFEAERLASNHQPVVAAHWEDRDMAFLQAVARSLEEKAPRTAAFLTAGADNDGVFLLVSGPDSEVDAGSVGPALAELLDGRGGGRGKVFQGKALRLDRRSNALDLLETV